MRHHLQLGMSLVVLAGLFACAENASSPNGPDTASVSDGSQTSDGSASAEADSGLSTPPVDASNDADISASDVVTLGPPPIYFVLMTHIEDNRPLGALDSAQSQADYEGLRDALLKVGEMTAANHLRWTLQPDWKILEAALLYDKGEMAENTEGRNVFRHLQDQLNTQIDPHSHENGGYNYTDVAYLLDQLGVGGSTVIGGHIWDPALPQFQQWDRYRQPVAGQKYPQFSWRGDILIGAGTPGHSNDPPHSGVWRPTDRDNFFDHDPAANIVAVGSWLSAIPNFYAADTNAKPAMILKEVEALMAGYDNGSIPHEQMLTVVWNMGAVHIELDDNWAVVQEDLLTPLMGLREAGRVRIVDFQRIVKIWQEAFGAAGTLHQL